MKDNIFIDTNILVYGYILQNNDKQKKIKELFSLNLGNTFFVSVQVINEFYSVLFKNKIEHKNIKNNIIEISKLFNVTPLNYSDIKLCLKIKEKYGFSYWDSLIISAALQNNCSILYTEDMQHQQIIENRLQIINPFIH